jgi:hypothetical protein
VVRRNEVDGRRGRWWTHRRVQSEHLVQVPGVRIILCHGVVKVGRTCHKWRNGVKRNLVEDIAIMLDAAQCGMTRGDSEIDSKWHIELGLGV